MGERERKRITEQLSLLRDAIRTDTFRRMRRNNGPYDPPKIAPDGTWIWWNIMVPIKTYKRGDRPSVLRWELREEDVVLERFNAAMLPAFAGSEGGLKWKTGKLKEGSSEGKEGLEGGFNPAMLPGFVGSE